jgi:hypothetical protein
MGVASRRRTEASVGEVSWMRQAALAGLAGLVAGTGCAGTGNRGRLVASEHDVAEQVGPPTATRWTLCFENQDRWHPDWILLPDGSWIEKVPTWSWVHVLPEGGEASRCREGGPAPQGECRPSGDEWRWAPDSGPTWYPRVAALTLGPRQSPRPGFSERSSSEGVVRESSRGRTVAASESDHPGRADGRRPRIVGRNVGEKEVLEIEVAEGDGIGSISLVSVDALSGKGNPAPIVLRLPFTEVGSRACPSVRRRVSVAIEGKAAPAGTYLLVAVAESGLPSAGELLVVEPVRGGQ